MPFVEVSVFEQRRLLVSRVLEHGLSVSEAARTAGVSRQTAYLWLGRAKEVGVAHMESRSKAPLHSPTRTDPEIAQMLVRSKLAHPKWGAKKHLQILWPGGAPIALRTADRILAREGLVEKRSKAEQEVCRFERAACNEMWQMDFKGVSRFTPYSPLSLIDDHSRFALRLAPLETKSTENVFRVLWEAFGDYGLPECILCDNGDCWAFRPANGPTRLEVMLLLLGVPLTHGGMCHPQTQGKVERFHGTIKYELGPTMVQPSLADAERVFATFVSEYNWLRPHEALGQKTPGSIYEVSPRKRPNKLPEHQIPEGATIRKVDASGKFRFQGSKHRAGHGLIGHYVVINEDHTGQFAQFAGMKLGYLRQLEV